MSAQAGKRRAGSARTAATAAAIMLAALGMAHATPAGGRAGGPDLFSAGKARLDVAGATSAAVERFGERYAGSWIDRSSGAAVLKVAAAGQRVPAALDAGPLADPGVELVRAELNLAELESARDRVLAALAGRGSGALVVDADPSRGAVVVSAPELDPAAREAALAAARVPVEFELERGLSAGLVREACFVCYPPWRAALPIRSGRALCTGAFTVYQGKRRKGKFRGLSAGHCQTNRRRVFVARRKVGKITANTFRGSRRVAADALRFKIPRKQRRAQVATATYGDVPVIAKLPNRAIVPYQYVCFLGRTTGGGCGYVGRADIAVRIQNKIFTHLWCAHVPTRAGDSGGPVVQPRGDGAVRAVGIVDISLRTPTSDEMCFSSINLALKKTGTRLLSASR